MRMIRVIPLVLAVLLLMGIGSAWSVVTLPTVNFSGNVDTTASDLTLSFPVTVSQVNYADGSFTQFNDATESIVGQLVTISGATRIGDYTYGDAVFTISDGAGFNYFSATLSNITLVTGGTCGSNWCLNPDLDAGNLGTLNLSNIVLSTDTTHPSRFIQELGDKLGTQDALGMKMIMALLNGDVTGISSLNLVEGVLDGVPSAVEAPNGARTIGYWKNHDEERDFFSGGAVVLSSVYDNDGDLYYYLTKKGKKSMEEKARQQVAALLLNCASSLDPATVLDSGELEILQLIDPAYDATATVQNAKDEIESVILIMDSANMENAKDLADEINNRDH